MADADDAPLAPYAPPPAVGLLIAALSLGTAGWFASRAASDARRGPERVAATLLEAQPRDTMPAPLDLPTYDGKRLSLASLDDKVVLVNFWATWCPPCVEEMPSVVRLYKRLSMHPRFVLLAVSADESWDPVRKFFGDKGPELPVLLDARGEVARKYGTTMFPETYVVKHGRIVGFIEGPRRWDEWYAEAYLRELLEQP